ncbi:hypothetical protein ACEPAG_6439 [Sanghuangporus baumii]
MANILDSSALLSSLPNLLPKSKLLNHPQDAIAALTHAVFSTLGFRLVGVDESSSGSIPDNILPDNWNAHGPGNYTLRYRHEQSSLEFTVKVIKLGSRTLINGIASETDKTASLDILTNDYVSPSFFPYTAEEQNSTPLVQGFISSNRITDFVDQLRLAIIQKLVPGLRKEGYAEVVDDTSTGTASDAQRQRQNQSRSDARAQPGPSRPIIPPEVPRRPSDLESHIPPENPLQIGRSDLDPLPLQNQPNPFAPPPLFPANRGDGMYVGPDHPIFGGAFGPRRDPGNPLGGGPWGGDGFLPPMGAPPGARFDPVFPGPLGPGGNRPRGLGGRGPRGQRGGDPDNDEFMPPGMLCHLPITMSSHKFRTNNSGMPGMRPFPKEKTVQIETMNAPELRDLYRRNEDLLRTLTASSSQFVARIEANQAKIRERLSELDALESIQRGMKQTTIGEETPMAVDSEPEIKVKSAVKVKKEAIAEWEKKSKAYKPNARHRAATLSLQEAIAIEERQNAIERERRERAEARREKQSMPTQTTPSGRTLTREEYQAKVWEFMAYKPTDSDMEGEDEDEDDEDEDPASWFHDDEDDGIKGQNIVYPDAEDLADVIRIDESKLHYSTFYEPRDEDF